MTYHQRNGDSAMSEAQTISILTVVGLLLGVSLVVYTLATGEPLLLECGVNTGC